ncbi:MAG: hypothetical protein IPJ40_12870 [Saprospirales bacterium]|nr:hypothetical protein [Saprospirales bacterium]
MRTTTTAASWKRAMLHAWLGFIYYWLFYVLTFGIPKGAPDPVKGRELEQVLDEGKNPIVLTGLEE